MTDPRAMDAKFNELDIRDPAHRLVTSERIGFTEIDRNAPIKPTEYLIDGIQETDTVGCQFGEDGVGKTFVAIAKAESCAWGQLFAGRKVRQCPVAIVASEGRANLDKRHKAWTSRHQPRGDPAPIYRSNGSAALLEQDETEMWIEQIIHLNEKPELLIVDTLNRNLGPGDESSTRDMTLLLHRADMIRRAIPGLTIEFQHHPGWNVARERGASSFFRGLDWRCRLTLEGDHVEMRVTKMKDGELPAPVYWRRDKVQLDALRGITSLAMVHDPDRVPDAIRENWIKVLTCVRDHPSYSRELRAKQTNLSADQVQRAMRRLAEKGFVTPAGNGKRGADITTQGRTWLASQVDPEW